MLRFVRLHGINFGMKSGDRRVAIKTEAFPRRDANSRVSCWIPTFVTAAVNGQKKLNNTTSAKYVLGIRRIYGSCGKPDERPEATPSSPTANTS